MIEALRGNAGYLTLTCLTIDSYERKEYLFFSGLDESGVSFDQETMEKLFNCGDPATLHGDGQTSIPVLVMWRLNDESNRHSRAKGSRSLEQKNRHFHYTREKLVAWIVDMALSSEKALIDTKGQVKARRRQAVTLAGQHEILGKIRRLERYQRQDIFEAEHEIIEKRDQLIDPQEHQLAQRVEIETLYTIRLAVE